MPDTPRHGRPDPDPPLDDESRYDPQSAPGEGDADETDEKPWRTTGPRREGRGRSALRETAIIIVSVLVLTWVLQTFVGRQYVIPSESMENTLHGCTGCTNDRIVIDKLTYRFDDPKPGDVVVFKAPTASWDEGWTSPRSSNTVVRGLQDALSWFGFAPPDENDLVKRVIATGGQTVQCRNADRKGVTVNGKALTERYIDKALQQQDAGINPGLDAGGTGTLSSCLGPDFGPITVPQGNLWVMGDNRGNSADSRYHITDELQGTVPISDVRGKVRFIIYPFSRIGGVGSFDPQR
ncbi:signal peptidase I [Williamsia serinedens]|uniref:Signal peptidase I n=1 Tax=Williamsia serinedens TaxID=391736 RepID=A0ABT1GVF2_9NOCA|nr:signal peptidase I [Williamsia serinedens]MCP2158957.1 signal peptidase I [Williamsia serinedens]